MGDNKYIKPTAQAIRNIKEYSYAKDNMEKLKSRVAESAIKQDECSETEWQARMDELHDMLSLQESLIDEYIANLPEFSSKYLGSNIKFILKKYNMKVSDLETLLNVSAGYISRTLNEDSKKRLSIDIAWQISKIFSVNIDELLNMNFCEPPKTVIPVIEFIEKLKRDTENCELVWKNNGMQPTQISAPLFNTMVKADGEQKPIYGPQGYNDETSYLSLRGDIFSTQINGSQLLLVPVEDFLFETYGAEFYVLEFDDELPYPNVNRICCTLDDGTGTLNTKAEELINTIKLHESDFVVSDAAKSFIDSYLNPYNPDAGLPFN